MGERGLYLLAVAMEASFKPDVVTYNASISACEKGEQWALALHILAEMELHKLQPNDITYNALCSACTRGQQWALSLYLLTKIRTMGFEPNMVGFDCLVKTCVESRQISNAVQIFRSSGLAADRFEFARPVRSHGRTE